MLCAPCHGEDKSSGDDAKPKESRLEGALDEYEALNEYLAEKILTGRKNEDGTPYTIDDLIRRRRWDNNERMVRDDCLEQIFHDLATNEEFVRAMREANENMSTGSNKKLKALKHFLKAIGRYPAVQAAITAANRGQKAYLMYLKRNNRQHYDDLLRQLREMTHEICESSIENSKAMGDNYRVLAEAVKLRDARDEAYLKILYDVWRRQNPSPATKHAETEREHDQDGDYEESKKFDQEVLARRMRSWNGNWSTSWADLTIAGGKINPTSGLLAQFDAEIKIGGANNDSIIGTWEIKDLKLKGTFQWIRTGPDAFRGFRKEDGKPQLRWTGRRMRKADGK